MSAEYDVFKTPKPESGSPRQEYHARLVPNGEVVRINELSMLISEISSFSSADVGGMLKAFQETMSLLLLQGRKIELEGLGLFSVALGTRPVKQTEQDQEENKEIYVKTVKFRCSAELRSKVRHMHLKRIPKSKRETNLPAEERKKNILSYLSGEDTIITSECMGLNHCTRYTAQKDLKELSGERLIKNTRSKHTSAYALVK